MSNMLVYPQRFLSADVSSVSPLASSKQVKVVSYI